MVAYGSRNPRAGVPNLGRISFHDAGEPDRSVSSIIAFGNLTLERLMPELVQEAKT